MPAPRYEGIQPKQLMNRVQAPGMPFRWSINPYRGCTHGCSFCYARATHAYLGETPDDAFQTRIFVKENAAEVLNEQLTRMLERYGGNQRRMAQEIGVVTIGTATDPYQPVEARTRLTRACLEVLARFQIPVSITTRSPLILRDLDLLTHMPVRSVNISVHTLSRTVWRAFEPATPAPERRLEAVAALVEHNIRAGVFLAPVLPYITDTPAEVEKVIQAAKAAGARFVGPSVLRLTPDVKKWFLQTLSRYDPSLVPRYERLYTYASPPKSYTEPVLRRIETLLDKYEVSGREMEDRVAEGGAAPAGIQLALPL